MVHAIWFRQLRLNTTVLMYKVVPRYIAVIADCRRCVTFQESTFMDGQGTWVSGACTSRVKISTAVKPIQAPWPAYLPTYMDLWNREFTT